MKLSEVQRKNWKKGVIGGGFIDAGQDLNEELKKQSEFLKRMETTTGGTQVSTQVGPPVGNPFSFSKKIGIPGVKKWYSGNLKTIKIRIPAVIYILLKRISSGMQISLSELVRSVLINRFSEMFK